MSDEWDDENFDIADEYILSRDKFEEFPQPPVLARIQQADDADDPLAPDVIAFQHLSQYANQDLRDQE